MASTWFVRDVERRRDEILLELPDFMACPQSVEVRQWLVPQKHRRLAHDRGQTAPRCRWPPESCFGLRCPITASTTTTEPGVLEELICGTRRRPPGRSCGVRGASRHRAPLQPRTHADRRRAPTSSLAWTDVHSDWSGTRLLSFRPPNWPDTVSAIESPPERARWRSSFRRPRTR